MTKDNIKGEKGKVVTFRRSLKHLIERHFILNFGSKNRNDAEKLVGKEVVWTSPAGKKIAGKISSCHGNKGLVRAIFERGLPGQAANTEVVLS
jgi:large subunit ribosomal protein L35Ae